MSTALQVIKEQVYAVREAFCASVSDPSIKFEAEAGFAIQALSASDYTMGIAQRNPQSVINAVTNVAAIGISLNPAKKQAYLVPRDNKICLDISYMGLIEMAVASGSIRWAQAKLVHENDEFELQGFDKPPHHKFKPFSTDRGGVIGVYVVAKTADGDYLTHDMDVLSVFAIRDRSSTWKAWVKDKKTCPWVTDPGEMTKKTCIKQASKTWPKTDRLDQAIHHLNTDGGEGLAILAAPEVAPPAPGAVDWFAKVEQAMTESELRAVSGPGAKNFKNAGDRAGYQRFSSAVQARAKVLQGGGRPAPPPPPIDDEFVYEMERAEQNA